MLGEDFRLESRHGASQSRTLHPRVGNGRGPSAAPDQVHRHQVGSHEVKCAICIEDVKPMGCELSYIFPRFRGPSGMTARSRSVWLTMALAAVSPPRLEAILVYDGLEEVVEGVVPVIVQDLLSSVALINTKMVSVFTRVRRQAFPLLLALPRFRIARPPPPPPRH